jgi:hypothetical protein
MFRCQTTDDLGLRFNNVDRVTWGFQFHVPKFDGHDELYVICNALTCDSEAADVKDACDRSCVVDIEQLAQKMKRALGAVQVPTNESPSTVPKPKENTVKIRRDIRDGPFVVRDTGYGPLINDVHGLLVVHRADVIGNSLCELRYTSFVKLSSMLHNLCTIFRLGRSASWQNFSLNTFCAACPSAEA